MNDINIYKAISLFCVCLIEIILKASTDVSIFLIFLLGFACIVCYQTAGNIMENSLKEIEELKKQITQLKNKKE